jgi:hypothetical protein
MSVTLMERGGYFHRTSIFPIPLPFDVYQKIPLGI